MNVGLHELSIGPGETPHGVGLGKLTKEIMVVGQTVVSFASRLEAFQGPTTVSSTKNVGVIPAVPVVRISSISATPEANNKSTAAASFDECVLPGTDLSRCGSENNDALPKHPDIVKSNNGKTTAPRGVSIRTLSDASIPSKHPVPGTQLETKHSQPAKHALVHASGPIQDVSQANAISSGVVNPPLIARTDNNPIPPRQSEAQLTSDSIVPVPAGMKDKVAKQQLSSSRSIADSATESPALVLQHPVEGGASMVSEDGKPGTGNQDLLGTKTTLVETTSALVSGAPLSSATLAGGMNHLAIKVVEQSPNSSSAEPQIQQHRLETNTSSLENAVYPGDGVNHSVVQASSSALEVGVPSGTHGWVKIRAEIHDGGLVHATLSARSTSGQEMLHRELPGLTRFLASEHVAVLPFLAEQRLPAGLDSGLGGSGNAADAQSGSRQQGTELTRFVDSPVSDREGEERHSTLSGGVTEIGPSLLSSGTGSWLNIRV